MLFYCGKQSAGICVVLGPKNILNVFPREAARLRAWGGRV
jgi:hypothetical protein